MKSEDVALTLTTLGRSPGVTPAESEACLAAVSMMALPPGCNANCWLLRYRRVHDKRRSA